MKKVMRGHYLAAMEAREVKDFRAQLVKFAKALDFETVTAMLVVDQPCAAPDFHIVDNTPKKYLDAYYEPSFIKLDPVMQHCKRSSQPIIWDQKTYTAKNAGVLWEQQARYGYHCGVAVALHFPGGRHFFLGVDRDRPLTVRPLLLNGIVSELERFAVCAQETASRIFVPPTGLHDAPVLMPLEIEILRWAMDGRTCDEISDIMNMSSESTRYGLEQTMRKLGSATRYQAVIKAIRLGLLT